MALATLAVGKQHLRITVNEFDAEITRLLEQSSAIVLVYIGAEADDSWTADTDPATDQGFAVAQSAVLEVLGNLWRHRGDADEAVPGPLTDRVKSILYAAGLRVPSIGVTIAVSP
jgi:hypothetical protein